MGRRSRAGVLAAAAFVAWASVVAGCADILGFHDLPGESGDGGVNDATVDANVDANVGDALADSTPGSPDASDGGSVDSGSDSGLVDAGEDAGPCTPGTQRCSGNAVETCGGTGATNATGKWGSPVACDAQNPVCLNGACLATSLDGGVVMPASCLPGGPGMSNCGPDGGGIESCCTSLEVEGGTFFRTYGNGNANPATVSSFRLDKYLVTVGRFRQFVIAWDGGGGLDDGGEGYEPPAGSGKHAYLNGGSGLVAVTADDAGNEEDAGYEPGWLASDDINIAPTSSNLGIDAFSTWTPDAGPQENLPIDSVLWLEAYAFCIWDGAFLPSAAEWEYAAAGGSLEREFPWGSTDPSAAPNQYAIYGVGNTSGCYYPSGTLQTCTGVSNIAPVGSATKGAAWWGQLDMAGDMFEWNQDWNAAYVDPCVDCTFVGNTGFRVLHGAAYDRPEQYLMGSVPYYGEPQLRDDFVGFRCARAP